MPDELLAGQDTPASSEAQNPAPAQPIAGTDAPGAETEAQQKETPNEAKTYSEDEYRDAIERASAKAAAKAERRALREARELLMRTAPVQQPQQQGDGRPSRDQFASDEQFVEALTDWKLDQRERSERQTKQKEQARTMAERRRRFTPKPRRSPALIVMTSTLCR